MSWIGHRVGEHGRYTLVRELGAGAMGVVFLAEDARLQRHVVVKILSPMLAGNPRIRERFRNEARIQAQLEHNNIVRALDSLEEGDLLAIVMEYAQGPNLDAYLVASGGRVSLADALALMGPVMEAIQFAHARGIVHRDLKPGNILLDRKTGVEVPKVADFGIAKILGQEGAGRTREGAVIGTPSYMPPEQLRGEQDLDHRADVYALGAILYQIVTGKMPLGEGSEYEITYRALSGAKPWPAALLVPGLPGTFDPVVAKALEGDRAARHASVAELHQDLRDIVAGRVPRSLAHQAHAVPSPFALGYAGFHTEAHPLAETVVALPGEGPGSTAPRPTRPEQQGGPSIVGYAAPLPTTPGPQPGAMSSSPAAAGSSPGPAGGSPRTLILGAAAAVACLMAVAIAMTLRDEPDSRPTDSTVGASPPVAPSGATAGGRGGQDPSVHGLVDHSDTKVPAKGAEEEPDAEPEYLEHGELEEPESDDAEWVRYEPVDAVDHGGIRAEKEPALRERLRLTLADLPQAERLAELLDRITESGRVPLWDVGPADAEARLRGLNVNALVTLDTLPDTSRLEIYPGAKREYPEPHVDLDFRDERLFRVVAWLSKADSGPARSVLSRVRSQATSTWNDATERRCEAWPLDPSVAMYACGHLGGAGVVVGFSNPGVLDGMLPAIQKFEDARRLLERSHLARENRALPEAISLCDRALGIVPSYEDARAWRGLARLLANDARRAMADVQEAKRQTRTYETRALATWLEGRILLVDGQATAALQLYREAQGIDPWNSDFVMYAAELEARTYKQFRLMRTVAWIVDGGVTSPVEEARIAVAQGFASYSDFLVARQKASEDRRWPKRVETAVRELQDRRTQVLRAR